MHTEEENHCVEDQDGPGLEVVLYAPPFFQRFQEFRRKELFADLYIQCGSECHFVHASVLAAACPPICHLLEASRGHSEDKYYSRGTPKPPYGNAVDEELEINTEFSEAPTGFDEARKMNPRLAKQKVKVISSDNGDDSTRSREYCVLAVPIKDTVDSHIFLSLSNHVTGVWNLSVQGIEPQVMNYIIQFVYWEKFVAAKAYIHNFITTARSLQLLGCESVCEGLQFVTPGEIRYFGIHDKNKTLDSSSRIGVSYVAGTSNKAGSCQPFAYNMSDAGMKGINPAQKLERESKLERSNILRWEETQGLNERVPRQEREVEARCCTILMEEEATKAKNFAVLKPSDKETKGRSISLWRPYEIESETAISNKRIDIQTSNGKVSIQERDAKARHDCVPRQEEEMKTRNDNVLKQQGETKAMSGSFLVPKQADTKVRNSKLEENTFSRQEMENKVWNYSVPKHEKAKDLVLPSKLGVLDNMNFPQTSRDTSDKQKCLICPREIYFNHSYYLHGVQNPDHTLEVGSAVGSHKMCDRGNGSIHGRTLQEGILHGVPFLVSRTLDTNQKLNLVLGKVKFDGNTALALSRPCNEGKAKSLLCTSQKMPGKKGMHGMEDCNERKDDNNLRLNDTTISTDKSIGDLCIIDALKKLYDFVGGHFLIMPQDTTVKNVMASGKNKFSKPHFKPNRLVRKRLVHNEHSYCKLQTADAMKISHTKVSHSSKHLRIFYKSSNTRTNRADLGNDARTPNIRFHSHKNKMHLTRDLRDHKVDYERNQEFNETGLHNTQSRMLTNTGVQRICKIKQSRSEGQDQEKLNVDEEKSKRGSKYQTRQDHPYFNVHLSGEKHTEPNNYNVSHNRNVDYLMKYDQNNSCDNEGSNFGDVYRQEFEPPNQENVLCSDLNQRKLKEQTNCVVDIPKQVRSHSYGETDVQVKVWKDKMQADDERKLPTEVNNNSEDKDKDYKVESSNIVIEDEDGGIMEVKEDRYKLRNDRKNEKVEMSHDPCVDIRRERNLESKDETIKGIFKSRLLIEENINQLVHHQGSAVTEVKLNGLEDNRGKLEYGDVLNCRIDDGKRQVPMVRLVKYEDGKEDMPIRNYGRKCPLLKNKDVNEALIEGFDMKDPLLEDGCWEDQPYEDDRVKLLPVEESNAKYSSVENEDWEDLHVDNDGLKTPAVGNILKDTQGEKTSVKDHTLKEGFRKKLECELGCDVRNEYVKVEVVHDYFGEDGLIDAHTEMNKIENASREEEQSEMEGNELNEPEVDEMEYEKKKIGGRNTQVEVNESEIEEGRVEPQVEKRSIHLGDQNDRTEQDVISTKLGGHGGENRDSEIKSEEVEIEDCSRNISDSQVEIRTCHFEDTSEREKLGPGDTTFSVDEFGKDEPEVVRSSDQSATQEKKKEPELEGDGERDREDEVKEKLDEVAVYSNDILKNKILEENDHSNSHVATWNSHLGSGDSEKVGSQEIVFNLNEFYQEMHKFSFSLELGNSIDNMGSEIGGKKYQALNLAQERGGTSSGDGDSYSLILKTESLKKNDFLRKHNSQDSVSYSENYRENSEIQENEPQSRIQMPDDALSRVERVNCESTKRRKKLVLEEGKRFEELVPPSIQIPKPKKKHNGRCPRRRKRKIQIKRQRLLKNTLCLEQKPDDICVNKAVESYQQITHSTQSTVPPITSSYMHYTKLSEKSLQISCRKKSCTRKVIEEDFSVDEELLSHVTWGKFEDEVEYVVVGDKVNCGYTKASHSYSKTSKRYITEGGIESGGRNKEFFVPPNNPGSVMDFIDEHSYPVQLYNDSEPIHQTPGRREKESLDICLEKKRPGNHPNRLEAYLGRSGENSRDLHCWKENMEKSTEWKVSFEENRVQQNDVTLNNSTNMHVGAATERNEKDLEGKKVLMSQERNNVHKSWSFVTNYENVGTVSSQNSARSEFTVEVGAVSVKVKEYSFADCQKSRLDQEMPPKFMLSDSIGNNIHIKEREQMCDTVEQQPFGEEGALQCPGCPNIFATLEALTSHFRRRHMDNKFFMYCPVVNCSARIANNKLDMHIKNHVVLQNFQCSYCSFSTATASSLGRHLNVHKQKESFLNKGQEHHSGTPYHQRRESGGGVLDSLGSKTSSYVFQQFREEISNAEIPVAEDSSNGIDFSSMEKEAMNIDNASTAQHKQYEKEMTKKNIRMGRVVSRKIRHPVGKKQPIQCCSMVFSTVKALGEHMRGYHKQGQVCVSCMDPACPVKLWTSNMDSHLRCHTVEGGYKCNLCTYSGRNAHALRMHTNAHRKNESFLDKDQEHDSGTPYHLTRELDGGVLESSSLKTSSYVFQQFREEISNTETAVAGGASSNGNDCSITEKGASYLDNASTAQHKQYKNKMSKKKVRMGRVVSSKIRHPVGKKQPIQCCSMVFSTVNALGKHMRGYHKQGQKCVPCMDPACPVMLRKSNMDSHLRCHAMQWEYKCNLCTYSSRNAFALRTHTSTHRKKSITAQEKDTPLGQKQAETNTDNEKLSLYSSMSCTVSHEMVASSTKTLKPLSSNTKHSETLSASSCHEIDKASHSLYHYKGIGKGNTSSVDEKFEFTKLSISSDHIIDEISNKSSKHDSKMEKGISTSSCEDFPIKETKKSVSHQSRSIKKVKFLSFTQRGKKEKEKLSCLGSKVKKKKTMSAIQKWKLSQRDIMLMNDSEINSYKSKGRKGNVNTKILTKRKSVELGGESKLTKECLLDGSERVRETVMSKKNIKTLVSHNSIESEFNEVQENVKTLVSHNSIESEFNEVQENVKTLVSHNSIESEFNEVQEKVDEISLSQISVTEEKDETSLVEAGSTTENTLNPSNNSLIEGLKRFLEDIDGPDSCESQSDRKEQDSSTCDYKCPLCVDYYDTPNRLLYHYVCSHAYHSPYICKFEGCPVLLKKRDSWKHLVGHLYKKSFRCHLCSYSHNSLHILRHHLFCHSEVIQELELRNEFPLQIQGPSGNTEILMAAEFVRKKFKRKFSTTKDDRISSKRKKEDICPSTESPPKLEDQK